MCRRERLYLDAVDVLTVSASRGKAFRKGMGFCLIRPDCCMPIRPPGKQWPGVYRFHCREEMSPASHPEEVYWEDLRSDRVLLGTITNAAFRCVDRLYAASCRRLSCVRRRCVNVAHGGGALSPSTGGSEVMIPISPSQSGVEFIIKRPSAAWAHVHVKYGRISLNCWRWMQHQPESPGVKVFLVTSLRHA